MKVQHQELHQWVDEIQALCEPDQIRWCDGSKNEYDEYNLKPLQFYETGVFFLNLYLFLPDVITSPATHLHDYVATLLYCGFMPFISFTFGKIYLSKKQEQERRIAAIK